MSNLLTPTEALVLGTLRDHPSLTIETLADSWQISKRTIDDHLSKAYKSLGVTNLRAAIAKITLQPADQVLTNNRIGTISSIKITYLITFDDGTSKTLPIENLTPLDVNVKKTYFPEPTSNQ